jgi:dihydrofolate synthase/folylpolyglutamate synthase
MDYQQTLNYLYNQLPMFTRVGASAFKTDLTNTIVLCERVGNPQYKFKSVHVGGTNGKGSTSHMLAAILQKAGYKTGLYTSPHLRDFRERIRINGEMISEQEVIDFVAQYQHDFETIQPSFFEMTVAMAFDHFARHQVDIAIIEVGLGGRLDSTNIITPLLSVITNIGWDHMNLLGNTLPDIAGEKAGIIKPGIPVIIGEYQQETADVFTRKAAQENARIQFASEEFELLKSEVIDLQSAGELREIVIKDQLNDKVYNLKLDLTGTYQLKNVKTVLAAVTELKAQGFTITDEHIDTALQQVKILTGLHGRWEVINRHPLTICDTGHNPDGMIEVLKNINATPYRHLHFVIGMVNDKDISKVLRMLPQNATFYFCKPDIPRGLEAASLQQQGATYGLKGNAHPSVKEAITAAQSAAEDADLVFVGGSTFVVAEAV